MANENTGVEQVSARTADMQPEDAVTVEYDFGSDLDGAVDRFGADVVYNRFKSAVTIDVQALIRRMLQREETPTQEEIQQAVSEFKPGTSQRARKSKKEKALELFDKMTDEEKAAVLESLQ